MKQKLLYAVRIGAVVGALVGGLESVLLLAKMPWWPLETATIPLAMLIYGLMNAALTGLWGLAARRLDQNVFPRRALAFSASVMIYLVAGFHFIVQFWFPKFTTRSSLVLTIAWTAAWIVAVAVLLRAPRRTPVGRSHRAWFRRPQAVSGLLVVIGVLSFIPPRVWVVHQRLTKRQALREGANRPNLLLIVMDTTRADHLSCYGYHRPTTPNLDHLAQEGVLFEQAYAPAPWTLPSHASLFTGLYPSQHGTDWPHKWLDDRLVTLAELLRDHGYQTAGFSNNAWIGLATNFHQGFEFFAETWGLGGRVIDRLAVMGVMRKLGGLVNPAADLDADFTSRHLTWWFNQVRDSKRPYFVFVNFIDPHFQYRPPEPYRSRFLRHVNHPAERARDVTALRRLTPVASPAPLVHLDRTTREVLTNLYDGEIAYLDAEIGELVGTLKARKLLDDTVVIITADHGENIGDHELFGHQHCMYETLLRVPLILRYPPALPSRTRVTEPVSLVELVPTLVRLLDLKAEDMHAVLPGRSWLGSSLHVPHDRAVLAEYTARRDLLARRKKKRQPIDERYFTRDLKSLRNGNFKFIWASDGRHELYDLSQDPGESQNLIEQFPDKAKALEAELQQHLAALKPLGAPEEVHLMDAQTRKELQALGYLQ